MKTTLKYNTIETLQEQPAWKTFIDAIVDCCHRLYDDNLIANVNDTAVHDGVNVNIDKLKLFDKYIADNYDSLSESEKEMYADIHAAYVGTRTDYDDMQSKFAALGYNTDVMHLNVRENISLRGLLRMLSLYKCRIRNIKMSDAVLPHTYKVEGYKKDSAIFGFHDINKTYDYETRGIKPDGGQGYEPEYVSGDVEADCYEYLTDKNYEEEDTRFKYIYNVYGYNQKHPIISMSDIHEVRQFIEFTKNEITGLDWGNYLYIDVNDIVLIYEEGTVVDFSIVTDDVFSSVDKKDSGVRYYEYHLPSDTTLRNYIKTNYTSDYTPVYKWTFISDDNSHLFESSYILNDNDSIDLIKENKRIKYNSDEYNKFGYHNLRFALSATASVEILNFDKIKPNGDIVESPNDTQLKIGTKDSSEIVTSYNQNLQKQYYVYKDSVYGRLWIVMDSIKKYFKTPLSYLKSQLFADECTLKVQPLFLYSHTDGDNTVNEVSLCANFINTEGGVGKISFEVEKYDTKKFGYTFTATDNVYEGREDVTANTVKGISYGEYFKMWEQFGIELPNQKTFFHKNVYTAVNFKNAVPEDPMNYFFDGYGEAIHVDDSLEDFNNNVKKKIGMSNPQLYENTFNDEYFETMYFNHFVTVYPIVDEKTDSPCSTMKLYCDNLELVMFGDIVPYIVSYDRIGEQPESGSEEVLNDLDCSIFSKIVSYNKNTHLLTVNNPVFFENSSTPKHVVVAYQNASPFNRIVSLDITSPNIYDFKHETYNDETYNAENKIYDMVDESKTFALKGVVNDLLTDYENNTCTLNLYADCEYGGETML